jgi:hypothetical protein
VMRQLGLGCTRFKKCRNHLKILGLISTRRKFRAESPQTLGVTMQGIAVRATWRPEFEQVQSNLAVDVIAVKRLYTCEGVNNGGS